MDYGIECHEEEETVIESRECSRDYQIGGRHYLVMKIQPWDIIDALNLNFYEGNVLKYLVRRKGDRVCDLKKAAHYIQRLIEVEERGT